MWALLLQESEFLITRERFLDMDDWEMNNILGRPSMHTVTAERRYWPAARQDPDNPVVGELGPKGLIYHPATIKAMKTLGMTDAEIETELSSRLRDFTAKLTLPGV